MTGLEMVGVTITRFVRGSGAIINHTGDTAFSDHTGVANLARGGLNNGLNVRRQTNGIRV